ncbi:MAG: alpha-amylase family protein, partial [Lentisphaerota bacterium]
MFKRIEEKRIKIAPCMDPYFVDGISADEMTTAVNTLKKVGINLVFTESLRRVMLYENEDKTNRVIEAIRMAADACHREGIKIIHHTTASFVDQNLNGLSEVQRNWLCIDAQTGKPAFLNLYGGWYLWCINNPDFRAEYFRLCKKIMAETGVDGFMVDEVYFQPGWHSCACAHCCEKYRKMTGFSLPDGGADYFWGNFENPAFRAWLRFRCVSVGDFYADLHKALNEVHPHPILMGCKSAEILEHAQNFGDSTEERMRGINTLFIELTASSTSVLYSWRFVSTNLMIYTGLSVYYDTPSIATIYHRAAERFFNWALRMAHNNRIWATSSPANLGEALGPRNHLLNFPADRDAYAEWFAWEKKHEDKLCGKFAPFASVGIFLGESTRDMLDHGVHLNYARELVGWCETLTEAHIQYAVIIEAEMYLPRLKDFSLVILPNSICLNYRAAQGILEYVKAGGSLILTHGSGERNDLGEKKVQEFRLRHLLGITPKAKDATSVEFGSLGLGKWAYFSHKPGMATYSTMNQVNTIRIRDTNDVPAVPDKEGRLQKTMMLEAVQWALHKPMPLTVKKAPNGILIKAFRKSKDNAVVIHILNCRGERAVKFGELIPQEYDVDFPKLNEDIVLELNLPLIKQAYLFSPDWDENRQVDVRKTSDGAFMLTIPADTLRRYEVL